MSSLLMTITVVAKKCAWWDLPCQVKKGADEAKKAVQPGVDKALHDTKDFFQKTADATQDAFKPAVDKTVDALKPTIDKAVQSTSQFLSHMGDSIHKVSDKSQKALVTASDVLKEQSEKSEEWLRSTIKKANKEGKDIVAELKKDGKEIEEVTVAFAHIAQKMVTNWFASKIKPFYCNIPSIQTLHAVENPMSLDQQKDDGLQEYIKKYSPVLYLHNDEIRYPIWISEYVMGPYTALNCGTQNYDPCSPGERNPIVPKGQVTMQKVYQYYLDYKEGKRPYNLYFDIDECVTFGSDPKLNRSPSGSLTTPVYVVTYNDEQHGKIYIQYLFAFGFNEPYNIGPFTGDTADFQDAHEFDLEHFTVELDARTKKLDRLYYSSHGTKEGFWMRPQEVEWDGTHPVVYVARGSHAVYPRQGTYIRIFGVANDVTSKDVRWTPQLMRFFDEADPRFDPASMGWVYHAGTMGRRGVSAAYKQGWFMKAQDREDPKTKELIKGGDIGRGYPESHAPYCPKISDEMHAFICISEQIPHAKPPL